MDTAPWSQFANLLLGAAAAHQPERTLRVAFDGSSSWLQHCQAVIEDLPCTRTSDGVDIVVTDSTSGPGWYFALNGQRLSADLREFFWHANHGPQSIDLSLHSTEGVEGCLRIPPAAGLYWREHHAAAIEAAPALLIVAILRRLGYPVRPADPPAPTRSSAVIPGMPVLNWFRLKKLARSIYLRRPGARRVRRWNIALHANVHGAIPTSQWGWTSGFADHEAADPFLTSSKGRSWLFYEDMLPKSRHGRIAVMPAFEGPAEPCVILEKPYHLSYPCVFEHAGEWWMIPESSANSTVDLYRANRFPHEWVHAKTLLHGAQLVDTTPLFHEGYWYFFTTALLPGRAYMSLLFVAETLDAPWRIHPASPLTGDSSIARGAGPITRWNGRLTRPVQNCLTSYGHSMALREIVQLSPTVLEETPAEEILPSWHPGLVGTHTFCPSGQMLALDALR